MASSKVADYPRKDKEAGLPSVRVGGRFITRYDPALSLEIVEKVAQGETINQICKLDARYPHPVTFKRWIVNNPELAKAYDAARRISAEAFEEEAIDVAREIKRAQRDGTQVRAYEVLLQQLRWSAERRDPAKYGTRAPISIRVPIQINTSLDMGKNDDGEIDSKNIYTISANHSANVEDAVKASSEIVVTNPLAAAIPKEKKRP